MQNLKIFSISDCWEQDVREHFQHHYKSYDDLDWWDTLKDIKLTDQRAVFNLKELQYQ